VIVGSVTALWRYPVKSMLGEAIAASVITERGLAHDRAYALRDRVTGKIASAKYPRFWAKLLQCRAAVLPEEDATVGSPVAITLPDGCTVVTQTDGADAALSAALGRDVALLASAPAGAEIEKYWPDIEGMPVREQVTSGKIAFGAPPGTFFDYAPIHLLTTATLDQLTAHYPAGCFDARRFRPNIVIAPAGGMAGFVENDWVGHELLIGPEARLRIIDPSPRCVVTTLAHGDDLQPDPGILRAIAAHNRPPVPTLGGQQWPSVGVYGVVVQGGVVRRDDTIRLAAG
jgi:MOSC domain-containing protein